VALRLILHLLSVFYSAKFHLEQRKEFFKGQKHFPSLIG